MTSASPGDSAVQRDAEAVVLSALAARLGVPLSPRRIHLPDGSYADVDGVADEPPILVEVSARQGPPRGGQFKKIQGDVLKLNHLDRHLQRGHRLLLAFADEAAARPLLGRAWYARAIADLRVEVVVVDIDETVRLGIREAQARQFR